jgi:hypothetical protein
MQTACKLHVVMRHTHLLSICFKVSEHLGPARHSQILIAAHIPLKFFACICLSVWLWIFAHYKDARPPVPALHVTSKHSHPTPEESLLLLSQQR